ncbi:hypothetical protein MBLNU459_g0428t1 [Dothideomycetes sp. NU459]
MPSAAWAQAELQTQQRAKLANSYSALLDEFSSADLHSVGNYSIGRLIGKGSFGKVVLKSAKKDDSNLAREIHHHRQFLHPHIARLYEVIVTETLVWLALEFCPGDELYNHISKHGRMEEAQIQRIFTQLVGAVAYVHSKSCVHRDLKLENILLDKHGNVKLVDFGFTREYQGTTSYLQTWCGTICYSAPEMLKGEKYAGEKVDVWSLGIILYALLVGELPFDEDDETVTKTRILKEDPKWPEYLPEAAKELVSKLLSKRPLLRPTLADILRHPWLAEHAPQQQEILKIQQPPPFSTDIEKTTLQRMRNAGVDIDTVIEHVLAQRCDSLAGWWALLVEKEERKEKRRQRRRKERDADAKSLRRLSAASSRLLRPPSIKEINEDDQPTSLAGGPPISRGRRTSRSISAQPPDLPRVNEGRTPTPEDKSVAKPSIGHRRGRSDSSTRLKPAPPPKELPRRPAPATRNSSNHALQLTRTKTELLAVPPYNPKRKRPFKDQLANIKHWFKESTKRTGVKSPALARGSGQAASYANVQEAAPNHELRRGSTSELLQIRKSANLQRPDIPGRATYAGRPTVSTANSYISEAGRAPRSKRVSLSPGARGHSKRQSLSPGGRSHGKRLSLSPAPIGTPRSSVYRYSGLRGRKSSSVSSVSSIMSFQPQHPTHSRASSKSSTSMASPKPSSSSFVPRSPQPSAGAIKVLPPSTPTSATGTLPAGIRLNRRPPMSLGALPTFDNRNVNNPFNGFGPPSPGMHPVFAKKKRSVFKGPNLTNPSSRGRTTGSGDGSRGTSVQGRRSGEIIAEEDEDEGPTLREEDGEEGEEEEMEIEEVDRFTPSAPATTVDETQNVFFVSQETHKDSAVKADDLKEKEDSAHGAEDLLAGVDSQTPCHEPRFEIKLPIHLEREV